MNKLPEQQILEEAPLYIRWSPDRSPYTLELKLDLVPEIARELAQGERLGIEVGGVLIGSLPDGDALTLRVEDMEMVRHPPEEGPIYMLDPGQHERFSEIRTRAASRGKRAVGFFRTHLRPGPLRPSLADRTFLSSEFTEPVYAVLLIQGWNHIRRPFFLHPKVNWRFILRFGSSDSARPNSEAFLRSLRKAAPESRSLCRRLRKPAPASSPPFC